MKRVLRRGTSPQNYGVELAKQFAWKQLSTALAILLNTTELETSGKGTDAEAVLGALAEGEADGDVAGRDVLDPSPPLIITTAATTAAVTAASAARIQIHLMRAALGARPGRQRARRWGRSHAMQHAAGCSAQRLFIERQRSRSSAAFFSQPASRLKLNQ
ncbi:hypothetical protein ABZ468_42935 [Streptomyces sp. NPDC005708]|uniref:hypothetical protein n=1 Tax=Streptomyces sp. NPDC005708 TaxID=3154564 RepID=UPI0033DB5184